jgi:hypothetical protein
VRPLVSEEVAFDAFLSVASILRIAPRERRVPFTAAEDDPVAGSNDEVADPLRLARTVVSPVEVADAKVAVLGEPPKRPVTKGSVVSLNSASPLSRICRDGRGRGGRAAQRGLFDVLPGNVGAVAFNVLGGAKDCSKAAGSVVAPAL